MLPRRQFLSLAAGACALAQSPARPNIVILLADDLGSGDLKHRGGEIDTPHLDRLATEGTLLDQAYVFPVCSPTRSGLMTGRSPMRLGVMYHVIRPWLDYGVPLEEHFLPESFRAAGYQTAITGKWHLGHSRKAFWPNQRGFDHAYGHVNGAIDYYTHERDGGLDWHRNGKPVREEGYSTDLIAAEACRWLEQRDKQRPFFLYVPFNAPHSPLQAPPELLKKYSFIADEKRRTFAAMTERMDAGVGRILKTLDDEQVAGETIVLFLSDNGGPLALGGTNGPRRDGKGSVYEGGIASPGILRYPGRIAAGRATRQVFTALDVFPTLAAAANVKPRNQRPFDGRNLWTELTTRQIARREDLFFAVESQKTLQHAVRRGDWKLVRHVGPGAQTRNELYQLADDPGERRDVSAEQPKLTAELAARIDDWRKLYPAGGVRSMNAAPKSFRVPADWTALAK